MTRMTIPEKQAIVAALHDVHEREDLGDDVEALVQLQHDLDELLATAASLLGDVLGGPAR